MAQAARLGSQSSPHVRRKHLRRRDEILHAALEEFRDKGYQGTTLDDIAGRLGLRNTALYHYFPDKESILYEAHRRSLEELERVMERARARYESPRERLAYAIREHVRVMTEILRGSPLAFEVPALSPEHQEEVVARRDRWERELRGIVAEGVEAGEFRDADPKIATFAILGAINWIARWYRPEGTLHAPELGVRFSEHLVAGLARREPAGPAPSPPVDGAGGPRPDADPETADADPDAADAPEPRPGRAE